MTHPYVDSVAGSSAAPGSGDSGSNKKTPLIMLAMME